MKVGKKDVKKLEGNEERSKKGKPKVDLECGLAQLSLSRNKVTRHDISGTTIVILYTNSIDISFHFDKFNLLFMHLHQLWSKTGECCRSSFLLF